MAWTNITKPSVGTEVSKENFGDPTVDNFAYLYALRQMVVTIPLNDSAALTTSDKKYYNIPEKVNGGVLYGVKAFCHGASSSGGVTITVKNGGVSMLSTNITIDETKTKSSESATQPVIDTGADDVSTEDEIEIAVTGAGSGVTYCSVELIFMPA